MYVYMSSYGKYLSFIANDENRERAIEEIKYYRNMRNCDVVEPNEKEISDVLFRLFIMDESEKDDVERRYDVDHCVLLDFPLNFVADILERFVNDPYAFAFCAEEQIAKLVYNLWPNYMSQTWKDYDKTYPHNKIFNCLHDIEECLYEFEKLDTMDKFRKRAVEMGQNGYYNWHILGFYPLLGDKGVPSFMNVIKRRYDDAQDMIMFSLSQYEPKTFIHHFKYILEYWNEHQNIQFETGTGMIGELKDVIKKYYRKGVNVYDDEDIKHILEQNNVLVEFE